MKVANTSFRDDVSKQNVELGKLSILKKNKLNLSKWSTITSMLQIAMCLQ